MNDLMAATQPYLVYLGALSGALIGAGIIWSRVRYGIGNVWMRVLRPAIHLALLAEINEKLACVQRTQAREFGNGVPPDDPRYVPMRAALDRHVKWAEDRIAIRSAEVEGIIMTIADLRDEVRSARGGKA